MNMPRKKTIAKRTAANIKPVTLKASPAQERAWSNAAAQSNMSRQGWCMVILDAAAGLSILAAQLKRVVKIG